MAGVADLHLDLTQPGFFLRPDYFDVLATSGTRPPPTARSMAAGR